jgi:sugar phosphate isomerase/epimerase
MVEDHGMLLAIENHCDFTGKQWAEIFEIVGSKSVGTALDTANGYTVYCDPDDDVQDLAPYTITTHLKDMVVMDVRNNEFITAEGPIIPMLPLGCAVGDGNVDIPLAIETMAAKSPCAEGLHLIIELGWQPTLPGMTREETTLDMFHRSVEYLKTLL